jgi:hypothetical protein
MWVASFYFIHHLVWDEIPFPPSSSRCPLAFMWKFTPFIDPKSKGP